MLWRISNWLRRISSGWLVIIAAVIFAGFLTVVLPRESIRLATITGGESPDLSVWYGSADLYRMADSYGAEGRAAYIRQRFSFDLVWPLVYLAALVTLLSWLSSRAFVEGSTWRLVNLLPVAGALLDYLENVSAALVMARYPLRTPVIDMLAGGFTALKWMSLMLSFIAVPVFAILAWQNRADSTRKEA